MIVLQLTLMTFVNILNGLGVVWLQDFYLLTETPNYDIDARSYTIEKYFTFVIMPNLLLL